MSLNLEKKYVLIALCLIALAMSISMTASAAKKNDSITFTRDIIPVFQENCMVCHRSGGANLGGMVAPMAFTTYQEARPWAKAIARVVSTKRMPPWQAAPIHAGVFESERGLTEEEIALVVDWVDAGAPRGNPKDAPEPVTWPTIDGWAIGKPDVVISMPEPYFVPDDVLDETKYFPMELTEEQLPEDRWIKAVEFRPGSEAVHHIIATPFGGIAPGNAPVVYRDGYSAKVHAGERVVWNMHYHKEPGPGTGQWDQSSVGIKFYPKGYVPEHVYTTVPLGVFGFAIPPGDPSYKGEAWYTFEKEALVTSMMPHMHYRGKEVLYELYYPDDTKELLLSVPKYDFNWQTSYRFKEYKHVPAGTKVKMTGWWDNSEDNPFNPDPTATVTWGEATHEEMMFGWVSFTNVEEDATAHQGIVFSGR